MNKIDNILNNFTNLSGKEQLQTIKELDKLILKLGDKSIIVKGLVINKISRHKGNKYIRFYIENIDGYDFDNILSRLYHLLYQNHTFKTFSRNKILDLVVSKSNKEGKKSKQDISKDNHITNLTQKDEFKQIIKHHILDQNYLSKYYKNFEIIIWKKRFKVISKKDIDSKIERIDS